MSLNQGKAVAGSKNILSRISRRLSTSPKSNQTLTATFSKISKLCKLCKNLLREYELNVEGDPTTPLLFSLGPNTTVSHHQNWLSLEEAVSSGCALCHRLLISALMREIQPSTSPHGFKFELQHIYWGEGVNMRWLSCRPTSHFPQNKYGDDRNLAELYLRKATPSFHNSLEASTSSQTTFKQIRNWYQQCEKTHKNCSIRKDNRLPSRLLCIQGSSLRLCESSNFPLPWSNQRPQYATLSHCWGEIDFIKLLTTNFQQFLVEIPLAQLTKTFRDAITITQSLGLSFLWIDSLCIIQDSLDDWRKESALMADVYGGSAITVAAADAKNGSIGCFFQRSPKETHSLRLETETELYTVEELMSQSSGVDNNLLVKRGWAFQERFLSCKVLHFTSSQVFWKCRSGELASEVYPAGIPSSTFSYHETLTDTMMRAPSVSKVRNWLDIVTRYSATYLTYYTDKLVALSGVAEWYQKHHKLEDEQYIAGIWKDQIWHSLLWMVNSSNSKNRNRPCEYQAPSWSWASQNEEVTFPIGSKIQFSSPYVCLVSHHITYPDQRVFGQVTGGHIRLRCTNLLLAQWTQEEGRDNFLINLKTGDINCRITWDHEPDRKRTAYLLPVLEYKVQYRYMSAVTKRDRIKLQGIVLQKDGENIGMFQRVGYFDIMLTGRNLTSRIDPIVGPVQRPSIRPGNIWRDVTGYFKNSETCLERSGDYIPEEEVYESQSVEDGDGEKFYEIIIV